MVSVNPSPPEGFYLDPNGTVLPGAGPFAATEAPPSAAVAAAETASEDLAKKVRKPYTMTKSRQNWTEPEHDKFLEALQLFDRDWKKIEAFIGSKTVIQIRSHAQKYFLKAEKSGTNEHLPPPRPKRKAAHPYPHKASKSISVPSQVLVPFQPSSAVVETGNVPKLNTSSVLTSPIASGAASSWSNNSMPIVSLSPASKGPTITNNQCSSAGSTPRTQQDSEMIDKENNGQSLRVLPDFGQVYRFIGSVFDPNVTGHLQRLKKMDPIDVETVLLLMRNLSINLTSPDFEDHRSLLNSYEIDPETVSYGGMDVSFHDNQQKSGTQFGQIARTKGKVEGAGVLT